MAHPSSSHRDRDDERGTTRERTHRSTSASHHHRTISSTTLLLVLSLILAVLAVMLSLPSRSSSVVPATSRQGASNTAPGVPAGASEDDGASHSFWGYLTPKRSHQLVSRESNVAFREAEVARREAELLVNPYHHHHPSSGPCPICGETVIEEVTETAPAIQLVSRTAPAPAVTTVVKEVIKEVIKEVEPNNPNWLQTRLDTLVERESKISEREKEISKREEAIGRRESDATKREGWIMEQLNHLPSDAPHVEEEYVYEDHPRHYYGEARRPGQKELPATVTQTVTVLPTPVGTRVAAHPTPETFVQGATASNPGKTREMFVETQVYNMPQETLVYGKTAPKTRRKWFGSQW